MKASALVAADSGAPVGVDEPVSPGEFENLMAALGPFERSPMLAVGVSGGPDSMALCALSHDWARSLGGDVVALIVDHRLRPESGEEARRVGGWLAERSIDHAVLTREGPKPDAAVHARLRAARYGLMGDYCRRRGLLHLLLAHHQSDQAETFLLRLDRASGLDGLAGMAVVAEGMGPRLLRPLLCVPMARLRAVLAARGLPSVDDPSNRDPAYGRVRMRRLMPLLAADGVTAERLARTAAALGRLRHIMEGAVAEFLAAAVTLHPAGFCRLDGQAYGACPKEVAMRALARMLQCIGGGAYAPRQDRLRRLHEALTEGALAGGRTLGGCRILPGRGSPGGILICREPRAACQRTPLEPGGFALWDGRFLLRAPMGGDNKLIRRLDAAAWSRIPAQERKTLGKMLPGAVKPSLPTVCDLDGIVAIPHLGYIRRDMRSGEEGGYTAQFRPAQGLSPAAFAFAGSAG